MFWLDVQGLAHKEMKLK